MNERGYKTIGQMRPGDCATLVGFAKADNGYRKKLLSMGLTRGVRIEYIKAAPMGDPVEIRLRGYSLSLRKAEADVLLFEGGV